MICPSCDNEVADDAAVCPNCDAVLDASLFDAGPPDEDAPPPPPKKKPMAAKPAAGPAKKVGPTGKPLVKKKPAGVKPVAKKAPPPDEDYEPPKSNKNDWRSQISEEDWKANEGKAPEKFVVDRTLDANDAMTATKLYIWELGLADKLALFGSAVMLLATFFPWKETVSQGDVLGVFSSGILVTVLCAISVAGILIRTRKTMPTLNPIIPWMAQLGAVGVAGVWCLVYMKLSWDSTLAQSPIGNYMMWVSKPSFGLIFALLAGIVSIVGTIFGLKDLGK
ncbi:MAG: hypothetical protein JNM17_33805 [Archangium sp.]|nr:hypothetical protein [Archangium sp.]